jgi:hypothetical protein
VAEERLDAIGKKIKKILLTTIVGVEKGSG